MTYGINAINDMPRGSCSYKDEEGKKHMKKFYRDWHNMLKRCYANMDKTYVDCYVCDEWLTLSKFKAWFDKNCVEGFHLDKDLMEKDNKAYSPDMCNYIPQQLNNLFCDSKAKMGDCQTGASYDPQTGKYRARCVANGKESWLGRHDTEEQAAEAYKQEKLRSVLGAANKHKDVISTKLYLAIINRGCDDYTV